MRQFSISIPFPKFETLRVSSLLTDSVATIHLVKKAPKKGAEDEDEDEDYEDD